VIKYECNYDAEGNASSVKATFYHVLDYLIEHPEEAGYFSHFCHSRFFLKASGLFEEACQNGTEKHDRLSDQYFQTTPWLKAYADLPERYELFKGFVLDVTVDYACEIAMGSLPNTLRVRDAIFAILFGSMAQFNH
jgi:hypothetical protein